MDDDPWANAWGEHPTPQPEIPIVNSSWAGLKPHAVEDEQEADIGLPSWSTPVQWNEPSGTEHSMWSQPTIASEIWEPSPYDSIPIATVPKHSSPSQLPSPNVEDAKDTFFSPLSSPPKSPTPPPDEFTSFPQPAASETIDDRGLPSSSPNSPRSASPDAFGTFESAPEVTWASPTFNLPASTTLDASNEWKSAWEPSPARKIDDPPDEWEVARRQKEKQDRLVVSSSHCSLNST